MYPEVGLHTICDAFGKTRQAHYKHLKFENEQYNQQIIIIKMVETIREKMPRIGVRKLYHLLKEPLYEHGIDIGRDKLFDIMSNFSLLVRKRKRRKPITTDSNHPFYKYPNLIKGLIIMQPNQLWVSDITYIPLINKYAYLSLITDAYSRKIVGYCLWHNLSKEGTLNALRMAIQSAVKAKRNALIHHSDRGLQYCCKDYINLLEADTIMISMTENGDPYENAMAERVNGILKSEFAIDKPFKSFDDAKATIDLVIETYNNERPHASCNYLTPNQAHLLSGKIKSKWKKNVAG